MQSKTLDIDFVKEKYFLYEFMLSPCRSFCRFYDLVPTIKLHNRCKAYVGKMCSGIFTFVRGIANGSISVCDLFLRSGRMILASFLSGTLWRLVTASQSVEQHWNKTENNFMELTFDAEASFERLKTLLSGLFYSFFIKINCR